MATPELQLMELRAAHEKELAERRACVEKLERQLAQMQEDTEALEREEQELKRQFGGTSGQSESPTGGTRFGPT